MLRVRPLPKLLFTTTLLVVEIMCFRLVLQKYPLPFRASSVLTVLAALGIAFAIHVIKRPRQDAS